YAKAIAAGINAETLISKARQYAKAKADVAPKWLKMPANWLKEECWLEDPQPRPPREPRPARAAKALGKKQEPAQAKPKQQVPVANSAAPVVKTADGGGRLALSPSAPKPAPEIAEPPKLAPKPATSALGQEPFTTGTIADGSKLPGLAIRADAPKPMPPAVAQSFTATKSTEPPKSQPGIGGEAIATKPPKPAPPWPFGHRVWHEKYGLGRVVLGSEYENEVEVLMDCQMEMFCNPA